ncbi:hypothetical protein E2C01_033809 [Portunus trituberculatus]|uniref:Uncharacterized protein n=1 Tax=Portunus trituberculatus TaxID=210409 RepID=A0A5B7F569_PORTR|nr:hypothetical protein [Portunus trituberculatus]
MTSHWKFSGNTKGKRKPRLINSDGGKRGELLGILRSSSRSIVPHRGRELYVIGVKGEVSLGK